MGIFGICINVTLICCFPDKTFHSYSKIMIFQLWKTEPEEHASNSVDGLGTVQKVQALNIDQKL